MSRFFVIFAAAIDAETGFEPSTSIALARRAPPHNFIGEIASELNKQGGQEPGKRTVEGGGMVAPVEDLVSEHGHVRRPRSSRH